MVVSLYTSRVVLNTLGIEDYGIYNLVGGIVVLFSFINSAMASATQRFLNFEMAKKSEEAVRKVFSISMNAHILIAGIIIVLAETIGLWFLNNKLNIPVNRHYAANVVYQFSIFTFTFNILKVPYNASVIAYEKMSFYAWISIIEVILKLAVVFLLVLFLFDKLILYAILIFAVSILIFFTYRFYCRRMFTSCHYKFIHDRVLFKELLSFSGWSMFGNMALVGSNQGISMILNIFLGVTINAAMGIAAQVNAAVYSFVSNFQVAFKPQIVKTYATGDFLKHEKLIMQTSRLSYYLLFVLVLPVLFNTEEILIIWLKTLPEYAVEFTQIIIGISLIEALAGPFASSTSASGKIRNYQIIISFLLLLNLPLAYFLLLKGYSPINVIIGKAIITFLVFTVRIGFVYNRLDFSLLPYIKELIGKVFGVSIIAFAVLFFVKENIFSLHTQIMDLIFFSSISVILSCLLIYGLGVSKSERRSINEFLKSKL